MSLPIKTIDFLFVKLLVFLLPFMFYLEIIVRLNTSFSDLIIPLVIIWTIVNKENSHVISLVIKKYKLIIIYLLLLLYACIISLVNYITNMYVDYPYGISAILKLSFNFIYVFLFLIYLEKYKHELMIQMLRWWKYAAVIVSVLCVIGVILYRFGVETGLTLDSRAQGTFNDPNMTALYLIISLSVVGLLNIYSQKKITNNLTIMLIIIAIFLTASRGGIVSLIGAICIVLFFSYLFGRVKELLFFIIAATFFLTVIFWINSETEILSFSLERVSEIGMEEEGTSDRLFLWETAYNMWEINPIIGVGIGQFTAYSTEMSGYTVDSIPHNTYFSFLAETGTLGFLAFLWFPLKLFLDLIIRFASTRRRTTFYLLIGLIALAIQAFTINIENFRFVWIYLVIICFFIKRFSIQLTSGDS